jgi:hypothetical protein
VESPNDATSILYDDMNVLGLDVFYDKPISAKGDALQYARRTIIVITEKTILAFLPGPGYSRWLF